jgi:hypothetical protein
VVSCEVEKDFFKIACLKFLLQILWEQCSIWIVWCLCYQLTWCDTVLSEARSNRRITVLIANNEFEWKQLLLSLIFSLTLSWIDWWKSRENLSPNCWSSDRGLNLTSPEDKSETLPCFDL